MIPLSRYSSAPLGDFGSAVRSGLKDGAAHKGGLVMRSFSFYTVLLLTLGLVLGGPVLASQEAQGPASIAKRLTNADVLDMLKAGLSQQIVIAKIKSSSCDFDTSP